MLAPTRSEQVNPDGRTTTPRRDGMAMYRVGSNNPVPIPEAGRDLGASPLLDPHEKGVYAYDRDRMISASMGVGALIALVAGTALFISSFETTGEGTAAEEQRINSTKGTISGIVVAVGFGLGIGGLIINPTFADRARIESRRYVFLSPADDPEEVTELVARHNVKVRESCRRIEGSAAPVKEAEAEPDESESEEDEEDSAEDEEGAAEDDEDSQQDEESED